MSPEEKQQFFHTALVQYGVKYDLAKEAARILASQAPDELLTDEQIQRVKKVCQLWLSRHKNFSHHRGKQTAVRAVSSQVPMNRFT